MTRLTKLDKFLIRLGIVTWNYKRYAYEMQRALDNEHLDTFEFWEKYYGKH